MTPFFPFQNSASPAPLEILEQQICVSVSHVDFTGTEKVGEIIIHKQLANEVCEFFALALTIGFPIHSVRPVHEAPYLFDDAISCEANNSSGFNYRTIHNSIQLSKHSLGMAFDINPIQNIYCTYNEKGEEIYRLPKYSEYDKNVPGTLTADHLLVILMKAKGWTWGGDWSIDSGRVDYQHFEKQLS
jgi:hypothetical protein